MDWIEGQRLAHPSKAEQYAALADLQRRKLWHQLTEALEKFVQLPADNGEDLTELYTKFIKDFENKLNSLKLVQIVTVIAKSTPDVERSSTFLAAVAEKVASNKEAYVLCRMELSGTKLKAGQVTESKEIIDDSEKELAAVSGADPTVRSAFYRVVSEYHKIQGTPAEFYKNALMYLSYTPIETIPEPEKVQIATDLALSALLGENVYNFGELLAHPVFASLTGTSSEWLAHFLKALNAGNIVEYDRLVATYQPQLTAQPALVANVQLLKEKITILSLMELVFSRGSVDRNIPFKDIADRTRLPVNEVEFLVMKALSLKLIRGIIDEVDQTVNVSWVQPRVLGLEQVATLKLRLEDWTNNVKNALVFVENETPELFV